MKFLIMFIFVLNLSANECGYGTTFRELYCLPKDGYEVTLAQISYSKGMYTCRYANSENNIILEKKDIGCVKKFKEISQQTSSSIQDSFNGKINQDLHTFADIIYANESTVSDHFIGSTNFNHKFNTQKLYGLTEKIKVKKASNSNQKITFPKIDSHTRSEKTLAPIITAAFTVDPSFFIDGFINDIGELELKDEFKSTGLGEIHSDKGDGSWYDTVKGWLKSDVAGDIEQIDALSFMDKQVLGYLVSLSISFKQSYADILFLLLGLGIFWSFGFYMYKTSGALANKKDDFNINEMSWLMGAVIAMAFFIAPVIEDGKINDKDKNWSTPAQALIRYFIQQGNYFGNIISDHGMQAYLNLISNKQGMLGDVNQFAVDKNENLKDINDQKIRLGADLNFYNKVCRSYFIDTDGSMLNSSQTSKNMTMFVNDHNKMLINKFMIGSNRLDYDACSALEKDIQNNTNAIVKKIDTVSNDIDSMFQLFNNDSNARKNFQRYINTMVYAQNQFGWITVPIVPISYFFFKHAEYFAYNEKILEEKETTNIFKNTVKNYRENDESRGAVQKMSESLGDTFSKGSDVFFSTTFWFFIPGFEAIYNRINTSVQELYMSQIHQYNAIIEKNDASSDNFFLKTAINSASKIIGKIQGLPGIMASIAEYATNNEKSPMVKFFISVMSILITIVLFKIVIEAIAITAIAVFLAIKITLFLLEILIFFFTAPVIGLFYIMMTGNANSKNFAGIYFKNLGLIAITPVLMTITTYLIIVVAEFLIYFFNGIMQLFITLANDGAKDLYSSSAVSVTNIVKKTMMIGMIEGISTIFIYFAVLVISTIMIFNFRDWFTKMAGLEGVSGIMKEGGNEIKQGVSKYVNPIG